MPTFEEVVGTPENLMGVKAVFGRSMAPVMCFGAHDSSGAVNSDYSFAKSVAEKALQRPFIVSIGGGSDVPTNLRGRVLELLKMTGAYGATRTAVVDEEYRKQLARWPVAVVASEIYQIEDEPSLKDDLAFPNLDILKNAFDGVRRHPGEIQRLWDAIKGRRIHRRLDVRAPPGFRDPGKVILFGSKYPAVHHSSSEGKEIWRKQRLLERDRRLSRLAKLANRRANGGSFFICEGCDLSNDEMSFFDAHHMEPLRSGERESCVDDFLVLCPSCHRWAHVFAPDKLQPLSKKELRDARGSS